MNLKKVIEEVLDEHKYLWRRLDEIVDVLAKATAYRTPEGRLDSLKSVIEIYSKYHRFIEEMKAHEEKEERFIFQHLDERIRRVLKKNHEEIQNILFEEERALEEFKRQKISIKNLRDKTEELMKKAVKLLKEHRSIEGREFGKLLEKS